MATIPSFSNAQLEALCNVIGDTTYGLTSSQIGRLLKRMDLEDPSPGLRKSHRLFNALGIRQNQDRCGNAILAFVQAVMEPISWVNRHEDHERMRQEINVVLSFAGYVVNEDGTISAVTRTRTLTQAEERAGRLRAKLLERSVHQDVLRFCRAELLQDNYFHAVFEATKSVAEKIRQLTGLSSDGAELVDQAFGRSRGFPMLAFNSLRTDAEQSEHTGLMNLMKGMFGAFRNVTAHAPKITWPIQEVDAMDLLSIASFLHRRLDGAIPVPRSSGIGPIPMT